MLKSEFMQGGASKACNELLVLVQEASSLVHTVFPSVHEKTIDFHACPWILPMDISGEAETEKISFSFTLC